MQELNYKFYCLTEYSTLVSQFTNSCKARYSMNLWDFLHSKGNNHIMKPLIFSVQADITNDQLLIALEPEVASVFCRHIPDATGSDVFYSGSKYMVIDLGGSDSLK